MLVVMGPVFQVSVARLYAAAILPGLMLAFLYIAYTMTRVILKPELGPPLSDEELNVPKSYIVREFFFGLVPPAVLILVTLGTIHHRDWPRRRKGRPWAAWGRWWSRRPTNG